MDLGGASTQIAFATSDDAKGEDIIKVSLYGYEYNIYTHSFLCYGKNEAEKRVLAKLAKVEYALVIKVKLFKITIWTIILSELQVVMDGAKCLALTNTMIYSQLVLGGLKLCYFWKKKHK